MNLERLERQIEFVLEIDKLKQVMRQTLLTDQSRQENSSEHSWHLAIMAIVLSEHANDQGLDLPKVLKMVLVHDLVEIDAGDTYCYDENGNAGKAEREKRAADRIFNILPPDQAVELRSLWDEFEERKTPEACFAAALDRLQPLLHNYSTDGLMWQKHGVRVSQVVGRNQHISDGATGLWEYARALIEDSVQRGLLAG